MNLTELLIELKESMHPIVDDTTSLAKAVAALGCLIFIARETFITLTNPERPLDLFKISRIFFIALLIGSFSQVVLTPLDSILNSVSTAFSSVVDGREEEFQNKKVELDNLLLIKQSDVKIDENTTSEQISEMLSDNEELTSFWRQLKSFVSITNFRKMFFDGLGWLTWVAYLAVRTTILIVSTYYLIILGIFGPVSFALDCFPNWTGTINHWLTTYISVSLWKPISDIFTSIINQLQIFAIDQSINTIKTGIDNTSLFNDSLLLIFQIVGIVGYISIPTVSSWIIRPSTSAGGYNNSLTSLATKAFKKG